MADAEIEDMRKRMTHAAQMDAINRQEGKPAMHKLKLLPEVIMLLNRNQYTSALVDPEINLLEAVRFFLEPLDDGAMPAYNIQRDLLTAITKLPINKDALIASGIGKVVVFYTKSKRTERRIKEMAEKLLAEWTRPILQRSDDYSKRVYQEADYDPTYVHCCTISLSPTNTHIERLSDALLPPPRRLKPKPALARCSLPVFSTVLVSTVPTSVTLWFRARQLCARVSLRVPWVPVARTVSARCKPARLRHAKLLAGRFDTCTFLFSSQHGIGQFRYVRYIFFYGVWVFRDQSGIEWGFWSVSRAHSEWNKSRNFYQMQNSYGNYQSKCNSTPKICQLIYTTVVYKKKRSPKHQKPAS